MVNDCNQSTNIYTGVVDGVHWRSKQTPSTSAPYFHLFFNHNKMKKLLLLLLLPAMFFAGCSDADIASHNLSKAADQFEISRRIVFYNGITGEYMLTIEGLCSLGNFDLPSQLTVACKVGEEEYKKHFLGLSDNVTYFVEQVEGQDVDTFHYRVLFKPATILPDIDLVTK